MRELPEGNFERLMWMTGGIYREMHPSTNILGMAAVYYPFQFAGHGRGAHLWKIAKLIASSVEGYLLTLHFSFLVGGWLSFCSPPPPVCGYRDLLEVAQEHTVLNTARSLKLNISPSCWLLLAQEQIVLNTTRSRQLPSCACTVSPVMILFPRPHLVKDPPKPLVGRQVVVSRDEVL